MFKDRPTARRVMLVAGVGSTMPLQVASINRGWKSNELFEQLVSSLEITEPINFILNQPYIDKLTLGPVYVETEDKA